MSTETSNLFTLVVVAGTICASVPLYTLIVVIVIAIDRRFGLFVSRSDVSENVKPENTKSVIGKTSGRVEKSTADMKRELDLIDEQFRLNHKTPADIYPANKIAVICHGCRARIGAGEGYKHYNVGTRGVFCSDCHQARGLPLRDEDSGKNKPSDIISGEGANNEV